MSDQTILWLRGLAEKGGKGVVNNIDARNLGRIADELERLRAGPAAAPASQGLCDVTLTERFTNPDCRCQTYAGNLGPCKTFEAGADGRCVYCDHDKACHAALAAPQAQEGHGIIAEIAMERQRQIEIEGYTSEHDDGHTDGSIASAAAAYALAASYPDHLRDPRGSGLDRWWAGALSPLAQIWKWDWDSFAPKDRRSDLIRSAALAVAEVERLDRVSPVSRPMHPPTENTAAGEASREPPDR